MGLVCVVGMGVVVAQCGIVKAHVEQERHPPKRWGSPEQGLKPSWEVGEGFNGSIIEGGEEGIPAKGSTWRSEPKGRNQGVHTGHGTTVVTGDELHCYIQGN